MTTNIAPVAPAHTPGWTVQAQLGGGADDGRVIWQATAHQTLTVAGYAALMVAAYNYFNARTSITASAVFHITASGGYFTVLNTDLAAQSAAVQAQLLSAANVQGSVV